MFSGTPPSPSYRLRVKVWYVVRRLRAVVCTVSEGDTFRRSAPAPRQPSLCSTLKSARYQTLPLPATAPVAPPASWCVLKRPPR